MILSAVLAFVAGLLGGYLSFCFGRRSMRKEAFLAGAVHWEICEHTGKRALAWHDTNWYFGGNKK